VPREVAGRCAGLSTRHALIDLWPIRPWLRLLALVDLVLLLFSGVLVDAVPPCNSPVATSPKSGRPNATPIGLLFLEMFLFLRR
jgi:hypothetical protein